MTKITVISPSDENRVFTGRDLKTAMRHLIAELRPDHKHCRTFLNPAYSGGPPNYYDVYRRLSQGQSTSIGLRIRVDLGMEVT